MHDILIAGGGYAGVWAALGAARQLDQLGGSLSIGLVSRSPYLTARPRLYEHGLQAAEAQIPLAPVLGLAGCELLLGEIAGFDVTAKRLALADGRTLGFETLILAVGSIARPPPIEGWIAHGHGIDTWPQARRLWQAVGRLKDKVPTIAVLGAGFTGLELATELAGWRDNSAPGARILLLERGPVIAAGYGNEAQHFIREALMRLGVESCCGAAVAERTASALVLQNGERIACDIAVWAGGLQPAPVLASIDVPRQGDGRLIADRQLRIADSLFAAGDVAAVPLAEGASTVMSCQHALSTGGFAGHNAVRARLGASLVDYAPLPYVTCLDLGPAGALLTKGFERNLTLAGEAAKPIKQNINRRIIVPPLDGGREALLAAAALERKRSLPQ